MFVVVKRCVTGGAYLTLPYPEAERYRFVIGHRSTSDTYNIIIHEVLHPDVYN